MSDRRRRPRFIGAVALVAATGMSAAPTVGVANANVPRCRLITDARGDGHGAHAPFDQISSPALDILSADVATGRRTLVVTLRMATTNVTNDAWANLGYSWLVQWQVFGLEYYVERTRLVGAGGQFHYQDSFGTRESVGPMPRGSKVTMTATSYSWTIPRAALEFLKRPGRSTLSDLQAGSEALVSSGGQTADLATSYWTYRDLAPSCLRPR